MSSSYHGAAACRRSLFIQFRDPIDDWEIIQLFLSAPLAAISGLRLILRVSSNLSYAFKVLGKSW